MAQEHMPNSTRKSALFQVKWRRVILDEAHTIKNPGAKVTQAAWALDAERHWCLTGTPITNKIDDLMSLFKFIHVEPFDDKVWFNRCFSRPIKNSDVCYLRFLLLFHCQFN